MVVFVLLFVCTRACGDIELNFCFFLDVGVPRGCQTAELLVLYGSGHIWRPRLSVVSAYKCGRYLFILISLNVSIRTGTPVLE